MRPSCPSVVVLAGLQQADHRVLRRRRDPAQRVRVAVVEGRRLAAHRESDYWDVATPVMRGLYRWHIPDPIYFDSDLRVTWQQIGTEEAGNFERQDDVASVAYWYQLEPHTPFDPIGDRHFRQPR